MRLKKIMTGRLDSMKLKVPFFWQYDESIPQDWRHRACTMSSLSMVLRFFEREVTPSEIIKEGLSLKGAYIQGVGWDHKASSWLAHNHGVQAYSEEFRTLVENKPSQYDQIFLENGIKKIKKSVESGIPVLVSIKMDFKEENNPHTIVIVGTTENGFLYHDSKYEDGTYREVSEEVFKHAWRRFAVFFER